MTYIGIIAATLNFLAKLKQGFGRVEEYFYTPTIAVNADNFSITKLNISAQNIQAFAALVPIANKDNFYRNVMLFGIYHQ